MIQYKPIHRDYREGIKTRIQETSTRPFIYNNNNPVYLT
jgi:hypothetical protein